MDPTMLRALLNNVALLFLLSVIFDAIYTLPYKYRRIQTVYSGLMISLICITILLMNIPLGSGVFYDTRSVLISSAALAFGLVPTLITAASAAILQLIMGGRRRFIRSCHDHSQRFDRSCLASADLAKTHI